MTSTHDVYRKHRIGRHSYGTLYREHIVTLIERLNLEPGIEVVPGPMMTFDNSYHITDLESEITLNLHDAGFFGDNIEDLALNMLECFFEELEKAKKKLVEMEKMRYIKKMKALYAM